MAPCPRGTGVPGKPCNDHQLDPRQRRRPFAGGKSLYRWRMGRARPAEGHRGRQSRDGRHDRRDRGGRERRCRSRGDRGARGADVLARDHGGATGRLSGYDPSPHPRTRRSAGAGDIDGNGRGHHVRAGLAGAVRRRAHPRRARSLRHLRFSQNGGKHGDRARADRRVRADHALELAALPDHRQGGRGARRGLHRDPQAQRTLAAERPSLRTDRPRCGRACRCVQPDPGKRSRRGRRAGGAR